MIDCFLIGPNEQSFEEQVRQAKSQPSNLEYLRNLRLSYLQYREKLFKPLDLINHFCSLEEKSGKEKYSSTDFIQSAILYLGSYLARRGFSFDFINLFQNEKEALKTKLINQEILSVAITTTLYSSPEPIIEIVDFIRKYDDKVKIILGGPLVYYSYRTLHPMMLKSFFASSNIDFFVISAEGEFALVNILKALKNKHAFEGIENIAYKDGKNYILNRISTERNVLEENPIDYSLFPRERLGASIHVRYSKSCPFSCAFCSYPTMAGKYVNMDIPDIEKDLDAIRAHGIKWVDIIDDTLNIPKKRFEDLVRLLVQKKYDLKWACYYRCCDTSEALAQKMAESGCEVVFLGVESASDRVLKTMNKRITKDQIYKTITMFKRVGITIFVSLIAGFPGETADTFQETNQMLAETKPDFYKTRLWLCHSMAPIWQEREKYGIKGAKYKWSHNTMNSSDACDLMEQQMLSIDDSIYVPDGELWDMFYLVRQGWTMHQVKAYLSAFNQILRHQLIASDKDEKGELFENVKQLVLNEN